MALGNLDFETIAESELLGLVDTGVPEGILIDYKRDTYGRSDADVREFLKDVSSFANTAGGHLVIGMNEEGGVASAFTPIRSIDADKELQRLESLVRDGIEPRIIGVRMKAVPIAEGGFVIVIRIPRSWNPPHRVSARNTNRFYARNSAGVYEISVDELRTLFTLAATIHDRIRVFHAERVALIEANEGQIPLAKGRGKFVLHLVPFSAHSTRERIDLGRAYSQQHLLRPLAATTGFTPRYNFDGFINIRGGEKSHGYTQLFRNGSIEAVRVGVLVEDRLVTIQACHL